MYNFNQLSVASWQHNEMLATLFTPQKVKLQSFKKRFPPELRPLNATESFWLSWGFSQLLSGSRL